MTPHNLTAENYFSLENQLKYMSVSQFKDFLKCEEMALAKISGNYEQPKTTALLVGSYVDAWFEGTLDKFREEHPEIFKKDGSLKADYIQADKIIERVSQDKKFMEYMSGEKQVILVGEIAGVPFRIKIDSLHTDKIVDLKCMKDFEDVWIADENCKKHFISAWGYDLQGAIYQEIARQNFLKKLPFFIDGCTKEPEPDLDIWHIPDTFLERKLNEVVSLAPRYQKIKEGKLKPIRCEKCDYCKRTKVIKEPRNFEMEIDYVEEG